MAERVARTCGETLRVSGCVTKKSAQNIEEVSASMFLPPSWQGCCCPDRRGSLTKLASWRCLAKTGKPNKVSVVDFAVWDDFGRYLLGFKSQEADKKFSAKLSK